jgi:hypothetical protein
MPARLTPAEAARLLGEDAPKPSKYRSERLDFDGKRFHSIAEATRWRDLLLLVEAGEIADLEYQPRFPLTVNGVLVATYVADARYRETATGEVVVEDTKGGQATKTPLYKLKCKLVRALYGIEIREV